MRRSGQEGMCVGACGVRGNVMTLRMRHAETERETQNRDIETKTQTDYDRGRDTERDRATEAGRGTLRYGQRQGHRSNEIEAQRRINQETFNSRDRMTQMRRDSDRLVHAESQRDRCKDRGLETERWRQRAHRHRGKQIC